MSDEEYKREKDEIEIHLEVIMDLLHKKKEDKRCGLLVRIKLRWHKLQKKKKEQLMNAQWEDEILKARLED